MGSGKNDAPTPPDPVATAGAQTGLNIGTAIANQYLGMVDQNTPFGSLSYDKTGMVKLKDPLTGEKHKIPKFTATTTLSPEQQQLMDTQGVAKQNLADAASGASGRLGNLLSTPMTLKGAPKVSAPDFQKVGDGPKLQTSYETDFEKSRGRVEKALMSRLNPSLDRDREAMTANLANRGIKLGSEAYDRAMDELDRTGTDARMQAILAGGQEQSRLAGLTRDEAMFGNSARQQMYGNRVGAAGFNNQADQTAFGNERGMRGDWLQEQFGLRNQGINEIGALLGTGQVQSPQFVNTPTSQAATTDYGGMVYGSHNAAMDQWKIQQQQQQQLLGGLMGLGGSAIQAAPFFMMSDRRLKTDVARVGSWKSLPLYLFRYVWGGPRRVGVMAQDVLKVKPGAVANVGGYLAVDYGAL